MLSNKLNQKGETIVEIMICLAILGATIGLSFGTANRSLQGIRASHERTGALKIAQGQLEKISSNPGNYPESQFCIDASGTKTTATPCNWSLIYSVTVKNTSSLYTVNVQWKRLGTGSNEEMTLYNRIYP